MLHAFDAECHKWDRLVLARVVDESGACRALDTYDEIRDWYSDLGSDDTVIAHNGGRYDALMLADALGPLGPLHASLAGSSIASLKVLGGADIIDTARVAPISLHKFSRAFGSTPKEELGLPCECGKPKCGGHCAIRPDMTRSKRRLLGEYCENDCRATLDAYKSLLLYAEGAGIECLDRFGKPRRTIGGWAWASVLATCDVDPKAMELGRYNVERRGYYGGRVEVHQWEAPQGRRYDLRSAYPAAMREDFPTGTPRPTDAATARRALDSGKAGVYACTLDVPGDLPMLPMRSSHGQGLVWATGRVQGSWTGVEIESAVSHGAKLVEVRGAMVFPGVAKLLLPFVEKFWQLREVALAKGQEECATWLKYLLNSPSGKFAQRVGGIGRVVLGGTEVPDGGSPLGSPRRKILAWGITIERIGACARPILAATITARTRARLLTRLMRARERIYCDTDCSYQGDEDASGCEPELGAWQDEGAMRDWFCAAPKMYRYIDQNGRSKARAKGVPEIEPADIDDLWAGKTIERRRGVETFRTAIVRSQDRVFVARELTRQLRASRDVVGRRARLAGGETRALHRSEAGTWSWPGVTRDPGSVFRDLP